MGASPCLRRSASRCWITSLPCPTRASTPRCCIRCRKSCFWFWLRPSPAGRIETRRHTVCHKVDWMTSDRHYPGEPVFPDLAMIGRIETEVERNGKIECETRYYLCSLAP